MIASSASSAVSSSVVFTALQLPPAEAAMEIAAASTADGISAMSQIVVSKRRPAAEQLSTQAFNRRTNSFNTALRVLNQGLPRFRSVRNLHEELGHSALLVEKVRTL